MNIGMKEVILEQMLVRSTLLMEYIGKAEYIFQIDETGRVIFLRSPSDFTLNQEIGVYLWARFLAHGLKLVSSYSLSVDDLSTLTLVSRAKVQQALNSFLTKGEIAITGTESYHIKLPKAVRILECMNKK